MNEASFAARTIAGGKLAGALFARQEPLGLLARIPRRHSLDTGITRINAPLLESAASALAQVASSTNGLADDA